MVWGVTWDKFRRQAVLWDLFHSLANRQEGACWVDVFFSKQSCFGEPRWRLNVDAAVQEGQTLHVFYLEGFLEFKLASLDFCLMLEPNSKIWYLKTWSILDIQPTPPTMFHLCALKVPYRVLGGIFVYPVACFLKIWLCCHCQQNSVLCQVKAGLAIFQFCH